MKRAGWIFIITLLLAGGRTARADDSVIMLPDLVEGVQRWAEENLDSNFLNALPTVDEREVERFFLEVQKRYQGDYVVDVAGLRDAARAVLPLLELREETRPYARWVVAQMDYLAV